MLATGPQIAVTGLAMTAKKGIATFAAVFAPKGTFTQWLKSGFIPWLSANGVHATYQAFNFGSWYGCCSTRVAPIVHTFQFASTARAA